MGSGMEAGMSELEHTTDPKEDARAAGLKLDPEAGMLLVHHLRNGVTPIALGATTDTMDQGIQRLIALAEAIEEACERHAAERPYRIYQPSAAITNWSVGKPKHVAIEVGCERSAKWLAKTLNDFHVLKASLLDVDTRTQRFLGIIQSVMHVDEDTRKRLSDAYRAMTE
jgi:hypothetical protein